MNFKTANIILFTLLISVYNSYCKSDLKEKNLYYYKNIDTSQAKEKQDIIQHSIELFTYTRFDWYPEMSYSIGGRPSTDYLKMKGVCWGTIVNYKLTLFKQLSLISGIGYYRYSFTNIKKVNTQFGTAISRNINYPSPVQISYHTDKYWYNAINLNIGVGKLFNLKKNFQITTALYANNYFAISQYYHLSYNPIGSQKYRTKNKRYFGTSLLLSLEVSKQLKSSQIGFLIQVPTFDIWKTDAVFPSETNNEKRKKWFRGLSIGMVYNYSFTKK